MADASSGAPSSNRNVMIVLSYLWLLALVPLLTEKDDKEVQWHAKHGLVLMVAELIIWIVFSIVLGPLGVLGCIAALFSPLLMLGELILHVICIVKGINGQRLIIPGVSDFARPPPPACRAAHDPRRPRRHPRLPGHAVAAIRPRRGAVPLHDDVQPLRRGGDSQVWRDARRLDGGQADSAVRTVDTGGDGGPATGVI
jgi:uncharacterized membrane protein